MIMVQSQFCLHPCSLGFSQAELLKVWPPVQGRSREGTGSPWPHKASTASECSKLFILAKGTDKMMSFKGTSGLNQFICATNHTRFQRKLSGFQMPPQKLKLPEDCCAGGLSVAPLKCVYIYRSQTIA